MQKFLLANLVVILGLSLSMVYSVALLGVGNTIDSINIIRLRAISLISPVDVYAHTSPFPKIIKEFSLNSGTSDFQIKRTNNFKSEEYKYPMMVPTNGIAGHRNFLYLPDIHPGIDIWTNMDGSGLNGNKQGYPVVSACSGKVAHYKEPNEEIEIICDKIPDYFKESVPSLRVKILYSHLGDGATGESYHSLKVGDRVEKGQVVGFQGNKSSFAPENRVVHLHFGVYDLSTRISPPPPLDPMYYIGIDTHTVGEKFISIKN